MVKKGLGLAATALCFLASCAQKQYLEYNLPPNNVAQYHTYESPTSESSLEEFIADSGVTTDGVTTDDPLIAAEYGVERPRVAILDSGCNIPSKYKKGRPVRVAILDDSGSIDGTVADDPYGHGILMAEIIWKINPKVELYPIKVFGRYGRTTDITSIVEGINRAILDIKDLDFLLLPFQTHWEKKEIHDAVKSAYAQDIMVVAAAGGKRDIIDAFFEEFAKSDRRKYGPSGVSIGVRYPAKHPEVTAIGAVRNFLGFDIHPGYSATGAELDFVCNGVYGPHKGTSVAAACFVGRASLEKQKNPQLNNQELKQLLISLAHDMGPEGWDEKFGYGRLDVPNLPRKYTYPFSDLFRDVYGTIGVVVGIYGAVGVVASRF